MKLCTAVIVGVLCYSLAKYSDCYMYGTHEISERAAKNYSTAMQIRDDQLCELFRKNYTKPCPQDADNITNLIDEHNEYFSHLLIIYRIERDNVSEYIEPIMAQGGPKFIKIKFNTEAAIKYYGWKRKFATWFEETINETERLWITLQWFVKNPLKGTPISPYFTTKDYSIKVLRV